MRKRWRFIPHDSALIDALERQAGVSSVVAQLLVARGITDPACVRSFLDAPLSSLPPPEALPGALEAAARLATATAERRPIVVYGDYDVDGVTGTALLYRCLKHCGAKVSYYIPHRLDEGYGLHADALRQLAAQGAQLVVTVDCGVASLDEAQVAQGLGLELIVTDHHQPGAAWPEASVVVHPLRDATAPPSPLCGAGVAFKVAWAVFQRVCGAARVTPAMRELLLESVGLAGIGTVADVVPLVGENRVLVRHALLSLRERRSPGMQCLLRCAKLEGKPQLTSEDVAFSLAPRLNAAGRLGQAQLAVELLTTRDEGRAQQLAEHVDRLNEERQSVERSIYLAAVKQVSEHHDLDRDAALVLADHDWHAGVVGIVAGRLAERFGRPVVLVALDPMGARHGVGSCRSASGVDLHAALSACGQHLVGFGGHPAAAGLRIEAHALPAFRESFCRSVAERLAPEQRVPELRIDAEAPLASFSLAVVDQIEQLAPFGAGNRRPLICATGVRLTEAPRRIGNGGRHLALSLVQHQVKFRAVAFGNGDWADELPADAPLQIAFRPTINEYRGRRSVELQLADWRVDQAAPQAARLAVG